MPTARVPLVKRLLAALEKNDISSERATVNATSAVNFVVAEGVPLVRAIVIGDRFVSFYVITGIVIPDDRLQDVLIWEHETNTSLFLGAVEVHLADRSIVLRHAIDCSEIPPNALDACLKDAWTLALALWASTAESLFLLLDPDGVVQAPHARRRSAEGDVDNDADPDEVEELYDVMHAAVAARFGADVADALSGTLDDMAETFIAHVDEADVDAVKAAAQAKGSDERAVLAVSAPGVKPIRLRFSPAILRKRAAQDAEGLTLLHHTTPRLARRILVEGFVDSVIPLRLVYSLDHDGVPAGDEEGDEIEAVLLTDRPLPPDDRAHLPLTLSVKWDADAPPLHFYEHAETVFEGTDASIIEHAIRRWHVPAFYINEVVRSGLAEVAIVPDG